MLNKLDTISQSSFDLAPVNSNLTGIAAPDGKLWVVDIINDKVYAYNAADGTRP